MSSTCLSLFSLRGLNCWSLRNKKTMKDEKGKKHFYFHEHNLWRKSFLILYLCVFLCVFVCLSCADTWIMIFWKGGCLAAEVRPLGEGLGLLKGSQASGRTQTPAILGPAAIWHLWVFSPFSVLGAKLCRGSWAWDGERTVWPWRSGGMRQPYEAYWDGLTCVLPDKPHQVLLPSSLSISFLPLLSLNL